MSYLVVGTRVDTGWSLEVSGRGAAEPAGRQVGTTTAASLPEIEPAVRALLAERGVADAQSVDLQLLLPDFEVDLSAEGVPEHRMSPVALASGLIALVVALGAITFVLTLVLA